MRDVMMRFASLGDNCELGFAQRAVGAEPMDMLRWASTPPTALLAMLAANFADMGQNITVAERGREFAAAHKTYGFRWHARTAGDETEADVVAEREARRMPALAPKLRKEMRQGSRIFVIKRTNHVMHQVLAERVLRAMSRFGTPTLMFVTAGAPVAVTAVGPRLLHGTLPVFAQSSEVPSTTPVEDWVALCTEAARIVDARAEQQEPGLAAAGD
jgi:hypothetical protein